MPLDLRERPQLPADRLRAHLLGKGHAVGLDFPVGVIRADADVQGSGRRNQHELDLSARILPGDLDFATRGEQTRPDAVEARHDARALDPIAASSAMWCSTAALSRPVHPAMT